MRLFYVPFLCFGMFLCYNSQITSKCDQTIEGDSQITSFLTLEGFSSMNLLIAYRNHSLCIYKETVFISCEEDESLFAPVVKMLQVNTDTLLTLINDNEIPVFKLMEGKILSDFIFSAHIDKVNSLLYLPPQLNNISNPYLVLSSELNRSIIWDASSGNLFQESYSLNSTAPMLETSEGILYTAGSYLLKFTYSTFNNPNISYDTKFLRSDVNNLAVTPSNIIITQRSSYHVLFFDRSLKRASKELTPNAFILDQGLIFSPYLDKYFFSTSNGLFIYNNELDIIAHLQILNTTIAPIAIDENLLRLYYANENRLRIIDLSFWPISFTQAGICERNGDCLLMNCDLCIESNKYACKRCAREFFKFNGTCVAECPYKQSFQKPEDCCSVNCSTCSSSDICLNCEVGSFLQQGACISCHENCLNCTSLQNCSACKSGFSLDSNMECQPNFCEEDSVKENLITKDCEPCLLKGCQKCQTLKTCAKCKDKFQLLEGICHQIMESNIVQDQEIPKLLIWMLPTLFLLLLFLVIWYFKYIRPKYKSRGKESNKNQGVLPESISQIKNNDELNLNSFDNNRKDSLINVQMEQIVYPVNNNQLVLTKIEGPDMEDSIYRMNYNDSPQIYLPKPRDEEHSSENMVEDIQRNINNDG